ncbi:phosphatase PAP2 family protein [Aliikangiella sp. IMCC44653]
MPTSLKAQFQAIDTSLFLWIQNHCCKRLKFKLVRAVSFSGDGWLYAVIAFAALSIDFHANLKFFNACLIAYAIQVPLYVGLKKTFKRNRPQDSLPAFMAQIKPSDQFSFPSGHTAAAFVMATQMALFFPEFIALSLVWALSIGASRVLLGVHYPGDILAGMALGLVSTLVSYQAITLLNLG